MAGFGRGAAKSGNNLFCVNDSPSRLVMARLTVPGAGKDDRYRPSYGGLEEPGGCPGCRQDSHGGVAQFGRALRSQRRGKGFESPHLHVVKAARPSLNGVRASCRRGAAA